MAKRKYTKRNTEPMFTLSELKQYGLGDFLQTSGAGVPGMGQMLQTQQMLDKSLGDPMGQMIASKTTDKFGKQSASGSFGQGFAENAMGPMGLAGGVMSGVSNLINLGAKNKQAQEQEDLFNQQQRLANSAPIVQNINKGLVPNTPTYMHGGRLRKYPNGGELPEQDPYYEEYAKRLEEVKPILNDKAELYYYTQQLDQQLKNKNPQVFEDLTSKYGWNPDKPLTTQTRTQGADTYAKANPDFYLSPEEQATHLKDKFGRYNELRAKYGKEYNLLGEGDDPNKPETWKVGARHAVAFNPVTFDYTKTAPANSMAEKKNSNFNYGVTYDPTQENPYVSSTSYKRYANGGYVMEYGGATHAGGGIPVDGATGNPSSINNTKPQAEVEDGEVAVKFPKEETPFIFSEKLGFAKQAKKIENKYSKRPNDDISQNAKFSELKDLMGQQEEFKAKKIQYHQNKLMKLGGPLDLPYDISGTALDEELATQSDIMVDLNQPNLEIPQEQYSPYRGSVLPLAATALGNLGLMAMNKKPELMRASTVNPELINLEAARTGIKENAINSRANRLKSLRGAGLSQAQFAATVGTGDADINRGTNEALRQSYLNEQMQNAQAKGRANEFNAQQLTETNRTNLGLKDQYRRQNAQYMQNIAEAIPAYFGQREKYDTLSATNENYEIVKDKYGRVKYVPKSKG